MRLLTFLFAASFLFFGCKKVTNTNPNQCYRLFEISKNLSYFKDINGQDSSSLNNKASFAFYCCNSKDPLIFCGFLVHYGYCDSTLKVKVNDSLMHFLNCNDVGNGYIDYLSINFPDIDSPIHWQLFGGNTLENYTYTYPAPFPYYNITFPDTLHYLQGFTLPCSFTNADSVSLHFLFHYGKTITFAGTVNSINISPNTFANVQDSAFNMMFEVYNQHTELVNGNHYIFRKANYVKAKTVIVP